MKKSNNYGYILAETLIVTAFVAGVLIYLLVQLTNLSNSYERAQKYNTVPDLYALKTISDQIVNSTELQASFNAIHAVDLIDYVENYNGLVLALDIFDSYADIKGVELLYATPNYFKESGLNIVNELHNLANDEDFDKFVETISPSGVETYRLIAKFEDGTYATLRLEF